MRRHNIAYCYVTVRWKRGVISTIFASIIKALFYSFQKYKIKNYKRSIKDDNVLFRWFEEKLNCL